MIHPTHVTTALAGACALELLSASAGADVVLKERTSVTGAGVASFADMTIETISTYSGRRARFESDVRVQSKLVRALTRATVPTADIVQLDEDKVYELQLNKKRYVETTLTQRREQLHAAMRQAAEAQRHAAATIDESQCEWSSAQVEVTQRGDIATIAGVSAERITVVATQSCKLPAERTCAFELSLDQWLAQALPGSDEAHAFQRTYADKMGLNGAMSQDLNLRGEAMFGRYSGAWQALLAKTRELSGAPVKTQIVLAVGGPQCNSQPTQAAPSPATSTPTGEELATASGEAAGRTAAYKAGEYGLGGVAGDFGAKIAGSLFRRKKTSPTAAASEPARAMATVMSVASELTHISHASIDPSTFEIPAGFLKASQR